ncbi:MAG: translocation/assembly module TamB, partial [Longimicrobiales bacterium]|nr:translocation/assembly module TamB [Longimicrobiales bacterium]
VVGSLLAPRVSLSSNSSFAIAESDLVSYLIFGLPSYALGSGQRNAFAGSLAAGLFSSELGSLLARDVGLDYLAISQDQSSNLTRTLGDAVKENTQVEIGQYLTENIFAALHWRPWATSQGRFAALRLETRFSDSWTLEGYWEDRLLRSGLWAGRDLGLNLDKVFGFFLYRQWGY